MKFTRTLALVLVLALALLLAGCGKQSPEGTETPPPSETVETSRAPKIPRTSETPAESPDDSDAETATSELMQQIIDMADRQLEPVNAQMAGICKMSIEAEGENILVIVLKAEDETLEDPDVAEEIADTVEPMLSMLTPMMRDLGITDPKTMIKVMDMNGALVYSREFTLEDAEAMDITASYDPASADGEPSEALVEFVSLLQSSIADIERPLQGLITVTIEARGTGTVVYGFHVKEYNASAGLTAQSIKDEVVPMFKEQFATIVPMMSTMGIESPCVAFEFFNPDGSLLAADEVHG